MRPRADVLVTLIVGLAATVAAVGCSRHGDGASCDTVGARFLTLAKLDLEASKELDPANRRGVAGLLSPMRDSMVRACREDRWSAPARACFAGAADVVKFRACEAELGATQRELLHQAASSGLHAAP